MSDVQPGWYDDGHGQLRWWDGTVWTDHVSPAAPAVGTASPGGAVAPGASLATGGVAASGVAVPQGAYAAAEPESRKRVPVWVWVLSGVGILAISAVAIIVAIVAATGARPLNEAEVAIHTYDTAWLNVDCDALEEATTEAFRVEWGFEECSQFETEANEFGQADRDYHLTINSRVFEGGVVTVTTTETYEGEGPVVDHATYTIVKDGDAWRINAIEFEGDDAETDSGE